MRRILLALAFLSLSACATDPIINGVPNLREVRAGYFRSGQPEATDTAWRFLAAQKITDVIKLNFSHESQASADEATVASRFGIKVHDLAINPTSSVWRALLSFGMTEVLRPNSEVMAKIKALIVEAKTDGRKRVFLIHCTHGWDRTGLVSGMVLVTNGDMSKDEAWRYMVFSDFHRAHIGLLREWRAFEP